MSDLSTSCCLADLFCIPVLEPPCYGSPSLIHTAVTVVDAPRVTLFYLSLHLHISALLPNSIYVTAFDLDIVRRGNQVDMKTDKSLYDYSQLFLFYIHLLLSIGSCLP